MAPRGRGSSFDASETDSQALAEQRSSVKDRGAEITRLRERLKRLTPEQAPAVHVAAREAIARVTGVPVVQEDTPNG